MFKSTRRATFASFKAVFNGSSEQPAQNSAAEDMEDDAAEAPVPAGTEFRVKHTFNDTMDFKPPSPMSAEWLRRRRMDVAEAARMQTLVNNVVARINAERRQQRVAANAKAV
ncbi:hypothetical protein GGI06_000319 [Coemansia sp. S85]|nr:hypothetical protein GGI06_000319 [Coemansia sp. S85]